MHFSKTLLFLSICTTACLAYPLLNRNITQGDVRIPVILVQFEDVKFSREDPQSFYTDALNKEGFNEYGNVGSVRDYYVYNSMGKYRPTFDVYGPITLPNTKDFYDSCNTAEDLLLTQSLDSLLTQDVDFSVYDNDGNGVIEAFSIVYAGKRGGNRGRLWPSTYKTKVKVNDSLVTSKYSTSDESNYFDTFIHEFGHILGLPDVYAGPNAPVVGSWSIMDSHNKIPPLLASIDRTSLGWLTPTELGEESFVHLDKLDDNMAISITNPENENEMYLLEYRTQKKWDIQQKKSGMLIWYIDYNDSAWNAFINNFRCHAREYVVRARPSLLRLQLSTGETCDYDIGEATEFDVFPGADNVTSFNRFIFRNGLNMNIALTDITESEDKSYVTFKVSRSEPYMMEIESSSSSSSDDRIPHVSSFSTTPAYSFSLVPVVDSLEPIESIIRMSEEKVFHQAVIKNGMLHVHSSGPDEMLVRIFSLNGQMLYETTARGPDTLIRLSKSIQNQKVLLQTLVKK